eukprot:13958-Eustigmatos_ZCMA.PRE.1
MLGQISALRSRDYSGQDTAPSDSLHSNNICLHWCRSAYETMLQRLVETQFLDAAVFDPAQAACRYGS